jgi:oligopeptide/dipeptide ABC transporter ATP-binding protein
LAHENPMIKIRNLSVFFDGDYGTTQVLNDINFDIFPSETLGIVGESGCGKTMTALSIMRLLRTPPARIEGSITFEELELLELSADQMREIRGNKISMIFQDPMTSLNPVFTIGDQLMEVFRLHQGLSTKEAKKEAVNVLRMVKVALPEKRIYEYPHQLSGGMRQRVMIAMALACLPKLLIADEPTTALDVTIQAQVLDLMRNLRDQTGTAIMFITHDLGVVSEMCERVIVLYCGEMMEEAAVDTLFNNPLHPYTRGLIASLPQFGKRGTKLNVIPGSVPPAEMFPIGCVFADRCEHAFDRCYKEKPQAKSFSSGHTVRCFLY